MQPAARGTWAQQEIDLLVKHYPNRPTLEVAKILGRNEYSVRNKVFTLGLKKTSEFLASEASGRMIPGRIHSATKHTQFAKGNVPWNKGIKGSTGLHPATAAHHFKPGDQPKKARPIGALRLSKDGLLQRKVAICSGSSSDRWRSVHELVWIEHNGPVPTGHFVCFKKGMRTTVLEEITIDRLQCISRAEAAIRAHPSNISPEFAELAKLRGRITRRVNQIIKNSK